MKNKLLSFTTLGFLLTVFIFLAVAPAWADDLDQKIKAIEQKLTRLRGEQMELKKDAVAAAAALPTFTYRPGRGATIEAADKAFSVNFFYQVMYFFYNATDGNDRRGSTVMDLHLRRNYPQFEFCLNNCFYDWGIRFDLATGLQVTEQLQWFDIHFEQMNPWFPTFTIADRTSHVPFPFVARSLLNSAQTELASDMLIDSQADNTAAGGRKAIALYWADRPIPGNLLPGDFTFDVEFKSGGGINRNVVADSNRKQFQGTFGLKPFVRSKNPWLEKIKWGIGLQADSVDSRSAAQGRRLQIMTQERGTLRVTLLDANTIGDGTHHRLETGTEWGYGPYLLRAEGGVSRFASGKVGTASDGFKGVSGGYWRIGHELFIWSPKGLLTGSASTPHSLQFGWAFERSQADCGSSAAGCAASSPATAGFTDFHRNRLINRDLALWYFITPAIRTGIWWWWYDSANTPRATQVQIGCTNNANVGLGKAGGKDCSWHTVNLGLEATF
ncbi:hypothetical protein EPO44_02910 [bacterium]|nr:MAG: hypothetical protein EPO44_02910 [bacterium]